LHKISSVHDYILVDSWELLQGVGDWVLGAWFMPCSSNTLVLYIKKTKSTDKVNCVR
jgi:hypothetical protein